MNRSFMPSLGYGYNSKTGETSAAASLWFDGDLVKERTRSKSPKYDRHEKFIEEISDIMEVTQSSINVQLKQGLFSTENDFRRQSRASISKRSMTYYITASKSELFYISNITKTMTDKIIGLIGQIENLSFGDEPNIEKAKSIFQRMQDSIGPEYITEVCKRMYLGVRYSFNARTESDLDQVKADLRAKYGSVTSKASFEYLRKRKEKRLSFEAKIVGEGVADSILKPIDLWSVDSVEIQDMALDALRDAEIDRAPVVDFKTEYLWKVLGLLKEFCEIDYTRWLSLEGQRNEILKKLFNDYVFLEDNEGMFVELLRNQALPEMIRDKAIKMLDAISYKEREVVIFGRKAMDAENWDNLVAILDERPNVYGIINYTNVLPEDRTPYINVLSFSGSADAFPQTVYRNNWCGELRLSLDLGSELFSLIDTVCLLRVTPNGEEQLLYKGSFIETWKQSVPLFTTGHRPFGDNRLAAREHYLNVFTEMDKSFNYELKIYWLDGKEEIIKLPKWHGVIVR